MLTRPEDLVNAYLTPDELVVFAEKPDLKAWLLDQALEYLIMAAVLWIAVATPSSLVAWLGLAVLAGLTTSLVWRFLDRMYTRYVLTDHRVIRVSGVLQRDHEWISWKKVTDISVHRSVFDRMVGTATIRIQSANEMSGFKAMTDVPRPLLFAETVVELVNRTNGAVEVELVD